MGHELAEKVAGLASRVSDLTAVQGDDDSSLALLKIRTSLIDESSRAIVARLNAADAQYQQAIAAVDQAIAVVGDGQRKIDNVTAVIETLKKVVDIVEKVLTKVAAG